MNKKWEYYNIDDHLVTEFTTKLGVSQILAKVLINRGITTKEDAKVFLEPTRYDFSDPFLMPDMGKAVDRIIKAINNNEKVVVYGDYDVDGITSTTVLKKFLKERGLNIGVYIPNRLDEGYGLNKEAIKKITEEGYTLMITVDCGISGIKEIEECNTNGIETIVTDHHEQGEQVPNAYAVIDAKRKDSKYPFRELAGVGVVFKLIQAISIKLNLEDKEYLKFLDIVAIGTIADIVPLVDENRVIAKLGLKLLEITKNIGLKELISSLNFKKIDSTTISFGIAPRINACGRMGHQDEALHLFTTENIVEAKEITKNLNKYNLERQEKEKIIFNQAIEKLKKENLDSVNTIVLGEEKWYHGVIGIVASRLTEMFFKPTILIGFENEIGKGSGRSVPGFDLYGALNSTSKYLNKYGGHEMAVGLTIEKNQFNSFRSEFEKTAEKNHINKLVPTIKIDGVITKKDFKYAILQDIEKLEPFGEKNTKPIFLYKNLKINSIRALSDGKHLKLSLRDDNIIVDAIGFNLGSLVDEFLIGDRVDIVGTLEDNSYAGIEKVQINIKDIMKSI